MHCQPHIRFMLMVFGSRVLREGVGVHECASNRRFYRAFGKSLSTYAQADLQKVFANEIKQVQIWTSLPTSFICA